MRYTVRGEGVDLAVFEWGDEGLPAAVVVHGVGSSARFAREAFAGPLAAAGYRLVAYDLRGHGASTPVADPAGHALDLHVADLDAVVAASGADRIAASGADRIAASGARLVAASGARLVAGVSLGAHVTATWAAGRGDLDGLIACMPGWLGDAVPGVGPHAAIAREVRVAGVAGVLDRVARDGALPAWLRHLLVRDWGACDPDSLAAALLALDGQAAPDAALLGQIEVATGVVGWPDDPGHPLDVAAAWTATLPRAALATTTIAEVGARRAALGTAGVRAWQEAATKQRLKG